MQRRTNEPPPRRNARRPRTEPSAKKIPLGTIPAVRERVYIAAPISSFGSPRYERMLGQLREALPEAEMVEARRAFRSNEHWRSHWPEILAGINRLAFLTADDGTIGAGVFQELMDARFAGLTVELITDEGSLLPLEALVFAYVGDGDPVRFARVERRTSRKRNGA